MWWRAPLLSAGSTAQLTHPGRAEKQTPPRFFRVSGRGILEASRWLSQLWAMTWGGEGPSTRPAVAKAPHPGPGAEGEGGEEGGRQKWLQCPEAHNPRQGWGEKAPDARESDGSRQSTEGDFPCCLGVLEAQAPQG